MTSDAATHASAAPSAGRVPRSSPRDRTREDVYRLVEVSDGITRGTLVERTGLSRSTVNHAVGRLLADGRVTESEAEVKGPGSGSGRPGTRLRATVPDAHVAAIDVGHNHVHVAIGDSRGEVVGEERADLDVDLDATPALDAAADLLARLRTRHGVGALATIVAGIPGPVDSNAGVVRSPTILSGWVALDPAEELARRVGAPVHVENDAVLGAVGEQRRGAGRGVENFLYVKASHGIGAGVVIGGRPYAGATGLAGEIGHTQLQGRTELCRCGNRGCLEAVVSVSTIREQVAHTHPGQDLRDVLAAAADTGSDLVTARILDEAGRTLGAVVAILCNLLNPAAVVVGGELGASGTAFVDGVRSAVGRYAQPATAAAASVVPAALGVRAELVGALHLAASRIPR